MEPVHLARANSSAKVTAAINAWSGAPMHVKAMAGAYVGPLLEALTAINRELHAIRVQGEAHGQG